MRTSLGVKLVAGVLLVYGATSLPTLGIASTITVNSYLDIEDQGVREDALRLDHALDLVGMNLAQLAREYGAWDDSIEFVEGSNPAYPDVNFTPYWFESASIDLVIFSNARGEVVWSWSDSSTVSLLEEEGSSLSREDLLDQLDRTIIEQPALLREALVFVEVVDGELYVGARYPVIRSDYSGPIRGQVILGRKVGTRFLTMLADQTRTSFDDQAPELLEGKPTVPGPLTKSDAQLFQEWSIPTTWTNHYLSLVLIRDRTVWSMARQTIVTLSILLFFEMLVSMAFLVFMVHKLVFNPLRSLGRHMAQVMIKQDFAHPVQITTQDEIGELAFHYNHLINQVRDKTQELEKLNQELDQISKTDRLTGLANRRMFELFVNKEMGRLRREARHSENRGYLAVLLCDIDHFKLFNDTYGHMSGDVCLSAVGRCIESSLRRSNDLACRFGGEEFVILLPDCDLEGAILVAGIIKAGVMDLGIPHSASPVAPVVTISIGVAGALVGDSTDIQDLLEVADRGLYLAKAQGRNRIALGIDAPAPPMEGAGEA